MYYLKYVVWQGLWSWSISLIPLWTLLHHITLHGRSPMERSSSRPVPGVWSSSKWTESCYELTNKSQLAKPNSDLWPNTMKPGKTELLTMLLTATHDWLNPASEDWLLQNTPLSSSNAEEAELDRNKNIPGSMVCSYRRILWHEGSLLIVLY